MELTCPHCKKAIDTDIKVVEEVPILIGYTARKAFSENGFITPEIGTPIHEYRGLYQIEFVSEKTGLKTIKKYYPRSCSEDSINYIVRETNS